MKNIMLALLLLFSQITWAQNVGIGTTTPATTLEVKGNVQMGGGTRFITYDSSSGRIVWNNSALFMPTNQRIIQHSASAEGLFYENAKLLYRGITDTAFYTDWFTGDGYFRSRLGVGITLPQAKLHVKSATDEVIRMDAISPYLSLYSNGVYNGYLWKSPNSIEVGSATGSNLPITLAPNGMQHMFIMPNGNVGIGTSSPIQKLQVIGTSLLSGDVGIEGNSFLFGSMSVTGKSFLNDTVQIGNNSQNHLLMFSGDVGERIDFGFGNATNKYGMGLEYNIFQNKGALQMYIPNPADAFIFGLGSSTSMAEVFRIKGTGQIGIGNNNANAPLAFQNSLGKKISLFESSINSQYGFAVEPGQLRIYSDAAGANISFGYFNANVYTERMFLNNNTGVLTVNGTNYPSDTRLKRNITPIQNSLQKIMHLGGYHYYWKSDKADNNLQTGILAQEVQALFPELVKENKEGILSVNYSGLIPVLIESIKEQQQMINEQQKQITELKKLVQLLTTK